MSVQWSFSSLKDFVNCPKQYYEVKVAQNFIKKVSVQMQYGTEVHKALEDYARDGTPLPLNYLRFKTFIDPLLEIQGTRYLEHKMALLPDKTPCDFDDQARWVRGIVDFMVIDGDTAFIIDYKTGSNRYPEPKQLKLMALLTFSHFPQVNTVKSGLLFLAHNSFMPEDYFRYEQKKYWADFFSDVGRMQRSLDMNHWPTNPTPLCKWCPVTSCEFNGE